MTSGSRLGSPGAAAALLVYFALLVAIGVWSRRRLHDFRDYTTGGGAIPGWMLMLSFVANYISTNTFVAQSAQSYRFGLVWLVVAGVIVACAIVSWWHIAPRLARFAAREQAVTLPDFFAFHFRSLRLATTVQWIVVVATFIYVLSVMRSAGTLLQFALAVRYEHAVGVLYLVTVVYCLFGGMWADVTTDCVQAALLALGAVVLFAALALAGGSSSAPPPPIQPVSLSLVVAVGLGGGLKMMADPKQLLVFYALRDESVARRFRIATPLVLVLLFGLLFPLGYLARPVVRHTGDMEQLLPRLLFVDPVVPPLFSFVVMAAMLAAAMSSLDSALLVIASCLEKHVLSPLARSAPSTTRARVVLGGVATLALLVSFRPLGGVIALTTFSGALMGAAFLPSLLMGLQGRSVPAAVVWASVGAGVAGAVAGYAGRALWPGTPPWMQDTFVGLACAVVPIAGWKIANWLAGAG